MALILEVRDANGVATLHRLNSLTLTIGRALSNDIILDDPYVDARHARIAVNEAGGLELHDTGSVNGVYVDNVRAPGKVPVQAGVAVRMGRSTLRFRDINEEVAPALIDGPAAVSERTVQRTLIPTAAKWQGAILGSTTAVVLVNYWLNNTARDGWTPAISGTIGVAALLAVWSVIWGAATRGVDRKLHFVQHMTVASAAVLSIYLLYVVVDWSQFLMPATDGFRALLTVILVAVFVAWIAEHLAVSTLMPARRRWRAGAVAAAFMVAIPVLVAKSRDATREHDEASIDAALKPLNDRLIPATTVSKFAQELSKLQKDVDKMLEE